MRNDKILGNVERGGRGGGGGKGEEGGKGKGKGEADNSNESFPISPRSLKVLQKIFNIYKRYLQKERQGKIMNSY